MAPPDRTPPRRIAAVPSAVETTSATTSAPAKPPHPLWPSNTRRPDTVSIYRLTAGAAPELVLAEVDADEIDGVDVTGSRAIVHAMVGDGVWRLDPHCADGKRGFAGRPFRMVLPDGAAVPVVTSRAGAPAGAASSSVDGAVTMLGARAMFDELRAAASREHDRAGREVSALGGLMEAQMQTQARMYETLATQMRPPTDTNHTILVELLRETRESNALLAKRVESLSDKLHKTETENALALVSGKGAMERELVDLVKPLAPLLVKRFLEAPAPIVPAPASAPAAPRAPEAQTLAQLIATSPTIDPATVDLDTLRATLARIATTGTATADDAPHVYTAGVLVRQGQCPLDLLSDLGICLANMGHLRVSP